MNDTLYLHCRKGFENGLNCPLDCLVFDGDLMILCRNQHGPVHIQPFMGNKPLRCEHIAHEKAKS